MKRPSRLLAAALRSPDATPFDLRTLEALVRAAREADLLGTLAARIARDGRFTDVPPAPRAHLIGALNRCRAQHESVRRELEALAAALVPLAVPVVLLKGAAYLAAGLPPAHGRFFSDVDILVPKARLAEVESALMLAGFATTHLHPYDQRYYRRWMHELPPMQHVKRGTVLDVHHTIVPETSRVALDAGLLFAAAVPIAGTPFRVLAPADMALHAATHLMHNEEFSHGLRDLVDLDALLAHFAAASPAFWNSLVARAGELDLVRPLGHALRAAAQLLGTPVPGDAAAALAQRVGPLVRAAMDAMLGAALQPSAGRVATRAARRALYVRGHWLKMPAHLLAWHLTVKALRGDPPPPRAPGAGEPVAHG